MTHLSYSKFTELMKNKGETAIATNECIYRFTGISEHEVCIQIAFRLKKDYYIGETGFFVDFNNIVTMTQAQSMYMSL